VKYALRTLWKDRAFSAMAVLSLAVGIGANTAIFSLVNTVLLRPLDFPSPERLVAIAISTVQFGHGKPLPINVAQLVEWRKRTQAFTGISAYRTTTATLTGDDRPELVPAARVSANLFEVLGIQPRLGRGFLEQEDHRGQHRVVILADSIWRRRFNADPSLIGRSIQLNGESNVVVGVLPPDFEFLRQPAIGGQRSSANAEMFRPLAYADGDLVPHNGDLNYQTVARLRPGVSLERAYAELASAEEAIDVQSGPDAWKIVPIVTPLQQQLTGDVRPSLIVLMAAVGAVILVLCVNLANLSLSRAAGRARESAIRIAIGATRWHLARQSIMETAILAAAGGGLGILAAFGGIRELLAVAPVDLPRLGEVAIDARVLFFAAGLSAVTAVLFGILPALRPASSEAKRLMRS
jgi:putative ABC transport system permease protein